MHGPLDIITPDELMLGQGSSSARMGGSVDTWWEGDDWPLETETTSESTYAALTWDIPTWQGKEDGMDRETQRNLALLIDQLVEKETAEAEPDSILTLAEGAQAPPIWLVVALGGVIITVVIVLAVRSGKDDEW